MMISPACRRCTTVTRSTSTATVLLTRRGIVSRRHNSSSATTTTPQTPSDPPEVASLTSDTTTRRKWHWSYQTHAALIVSRPPVITRELSTFEAAYYAYQRHLKSRLVSPFPTDFYFAKGSPAAKRWQAGEAARQDAVSLLPRSEGVSTDRELTTEERELQDEADIAKQLARPRRTPADESNDVTSLDRALDRTLYLVVKTPDDEDSWRFPQTPIGAKELLHQAAERGLDAAVGRDLKRWIVAHHPVGHHAYAYPAGQQKVGCTGAKVYFLKARALAGRCNTAEGVQYAWLTKEELEGKLEKEYWKAVGPILSSV